MFLKFCAVWFLIIRDMRIQKYMRLYRRILYKLGHSSFNICHTEKWSVRKLIVLQWWTLYKFSFWYLSKGKWQNTPLLIIEQLYSVSIKFHRIASNIKVAAYDETNLSYKSLEAWIINARDVSLWKLLTIAQYLLTEHSMLWYIIGFKSWSREHD